MQLVCMCLSHIGKTPKASLNHKRYEPVTFYPNKQQVQTAVIGTASFYRIPHFNVSDENHLYICASLSNNKQMDFFASVFFF